MRRRNMSGESYGRGIGADRVGPPPPASSVSNSFPAAQPTSANIQVNNPIKPGKSLHKAGQLHGKGKSRRY